MKWRPLCNRFLYRHMHIIPAFSSLIRQTSEPVGFLLSWYRFSFFSNDFFLSRPISMSVFTPNLKKYETEVSLTLSPRALFSTYKSLFYYHILLHPKHILIKLHYIQVAAFEQNKMADMIFYVAHQLPRKISLTCKAWNWIISFRLFS